MRFFKYLFALIVLLLSSHVFADCEPNILGAFESNLTDPPYLICASHSDFAGKKCIMLIDNMQQTSNGWTLFGHTTGTECTAETELNRPQQYNCTEDVCPVTEEQTCPSTHQKGMYNGQLSCVRINDDDDDVLQCAANECLNPENKRCPVGYNSGSINGQSVCTKKTDDDDDDDDDSSVVNAVNNAKNDIVNAINALSTSISNKVDQLLSDLNNEDDEDDENNGGGLDTSGLEANVPYVEYDDKELNQNLFNYNATCPSDNTLSMSFMNSNFTYTFKYSKICGGLEILGYFFLAIAYAYAAKIVVQA